MRKFLITLLVSLLSLPTFAQVWGVDPVLPGLILGYTIHADSLYNKQQRVMLEQSTGHIWEKEEVEAVFDLQEQFDKYLKSFNGVVVYAAQTYGFYYEIDQMMTNMRSLTNTIGSKPVNAVAIALSARRNDIYTDIIMTTTGIITNIKDVCLDAMMTEKERIDLLFDIRPRLKKLNRLLKTLETLCRTTTLSDVWLEVQGRRKGYDSKQDIIEQCYREWKLNIKKVK